MSGRMGRKKKTLLGKPGKGVDREAKPKNAFFRFFELLVQRIYKICVFNIIYFICILPLLCALATGFIMLLGIPAETVANTVLLNWMLRASLWLPMPVSIALVVVSAVFYGPMTCGFAYAMRNLASDSHAWYSDIFSRAMANFKQGFVLGLVDIFVFASVLLYIGADFSQVSGGMYYFYSFLRVLAVLIAIFYQFMRYYLYPIAVTFELPLKAIFKNAYLFGVLGLWRNILVTVVCALSIFAFASTAYLDVFLMVTFTFGFCGFLASYATYPVIRKYMLDTKEKPKEKPNE